VKRKVEGEQTRTLTPKEQAFVDAITTPPFPTMEVAAAEAGLSYSWARQIRHMPHIANAVDERMAEFERINRIRGQAVMDRLDRRSERDDSVGNEAAKLYLEAIGRVGRGAQINVTQTVSQTQEGPIEDRIKRIRAERFTLVNES
jgi:hypothetical protein